MNWSAQVVHVAKKDLRQACWLLLAYWAGIVVVTIQFMKWPESAEVSGFWGFLLVPFGMVTAAAMVQADSPSRTDSFWATRPVSASAVATAKVLAVIIGLLLPGLIAEGVAISSLDPAWNVLLGQLARSLIAQATLLAAAMALATLTRGIGTFILVLAAAVIMDAATTLWIWPHGRIHVNPALPKLLTFAAALAALCVLFYQYRSRNLRRGRIVAGALTTMYMFLPPMTPVASATATSGDRVDITSATVDRRPVPQIVSLKFRPATLDLGDRTSVSRPHVEFIKPDNHRDTASVNRFSGIAPGTLPLESDLRWLAPSIHPMNSEPLSFALEDEQVEAILAGRTKLRVSGMLNIERPRVVARLPLVPGATIAVGGTRVTYSGIDGSQRNRELKVAILSVTDQDAQNDFTRQQNAFDFVLLNEARHEAIGLSQGGTSGGPNAAPMPGTSFYALKSNLRIGDGTSQQAGLVDATWLRDARLVVVKWTSHRTAKIDLTIDPQSIEVSGTASVPPKRRTVDGSTRPSFPPR